MERHRRVALVPFSFLLDQIPDWKRAYGPEGLVQYQTQIPHARAADVFTEQLERVHAAGLRPYVGIFKRHRGDRFLMSHAVDGYSLAMDFKVTPENRNALRTLAADLDARVIAAGGRFYFAKDSMLTADSFAPVRAEARVQRFLSLKRELDPDGRFMTDLFRRIFDDARVAT